MANEMLERTVHPTLGCDPELFIATDKGVVGAERVIPKEGLHVPYIWAGENPGIVLDGVQLELHPGPSSCRQSLAVNLAALFRQFDLALKTKAGGFKASFDPVIMVPKKELDQLSDQAKVLGCSPSLNGHDPKATIKVSKRDARMRSAGGHIHLGFDMHWAMQAMKTPAVVKMVQLLDVLCGLPCVLIDRDPQQARRRRVYGRAGEYRLPPHGIEYRVPSNFWLRHYHLMSFVMGQCRLAYQVFVSSYYVGHRGFNFAEDLLAQVDIKKVAKAINRNNYDQAMKQWIKVAAWIEEYVSPGMNSGLCQGNTADFLYFAETVRENGLTHWFPTDPLDHWCGRGGGGPGSAGFESFLSSKVRKQRVKAETEKLSELTKAA